MTVLSNKDDHGFAAQGCFTKITDVPGVDEEGQSADKLLTPKFTGSSEHKSLPTSKKSGKRIVTADSLHLPTRRKQKARSKRRTVYRYECQISELLVSAAESPIAAEHLQSLVHIHRHQPSSRWRGYAAIPPGSLLESVCREFQIGTSIPLEVPLAHLLGYIAGYLCRRGIYLLKGADRVDPVLWMILLANSGAGKTWTTRHIRDGCQIEDSEIAGIGGSASAAMLFDRIHKQPTGLWLHDEFGQFISRLDQNPKDSEMKEYVLKIYDGDGLTRGTKKEGERSTGPTQICVLGMSQHETWHEIMPPRAMLDGTAQRFLYMIVRDDPARNYRDFADWSVNYDGWAEQWQQCTEAIQPFYTTSEAAMAVYKQAFHDLADRHLPQSFYRRLMFASHRLALIYHVLARDPSPTLTVTDYGWALRLTRLFMEDCVGVVGENSVSELQRAMGKAQEISDRLAARGQRLKPRDLIANMRCIESVNQAEGLMRLIGIYRSGH